MVGLLALLPLVVALGLFGVAAAARWSARVDRRVAHVARVTADRFVAPADHEREQLLQSAYVAEPYRTYATKTVLYAGVFAVAGGIGIAYLLAGVIAFVPALGAALSQLPSTMVAVLGQPSTWSLDLAPPVYYGVLVGGGAIGGLLCGGLTYLLRWELPKSRAEARRRQIDEGMARTMAFLYALSRGGLGFPAVMRTLADHPDVYGESAREIAVGVREMDMFGTDVLTAVRRMAERSPSEEFKTFGENLASVLQSGQDLPAFLREQYERYQTEAEERQEEVLELLATIAEAYVTVLVAGTLFLITILLVFGLTTTDTLWLIQLLAYLAIPLANVGFMVFLDQQLETLGIGSSASVSASQPAGTTASPGSADASAAGSAAADGGTAAHLGANFERLAVYDRLAGLKRVARQPVSTIVRRPTALLYVTAPIALVATALRLPAATTGVGVNVRVLDDLLIQAALFVMGTFAVVQFLHKRRLSRIEAATPELLERLASLNEAGMSVVESFERVRGSDVGALSTEVERIWADISLGANVEDALVRFGNRVRTTPVTRAVTLLANAMRASGNIGSVLRIAGTQARADLQMKRRRRRQMLTYLIVIYVAFAVFLVIIISVDKVLVPSLPESVPTPPPDNRLGIDAAQFTRFGRVNKAAYTLVFFHTALVQAVLSGFIGGQIGEGSIRDGAKHATIMLGIAYVLFLLLSSPVASLQMGPQAHGDRVTIDSATLSQGGFVVVHAHSADGQVVGTSGYLPAGTSTNVTIPLDEPIPAGSTAVLVPHLDTDGNHRYDGGAGAGDLDKVYPPGGDAVAEKATIKQNQYA
ncbi:MAG: type II secretion system F family protein [Haloarculaceae archaeon]